MSTIPATEAVAHSCPEASPEYAQEGIPWLALTADTTSIAPAPADSEVQGATGINIYFPPEYCHDYHGLTWREMCLKQRRLKPGESIASLWLRGFPLQQFNPDELTEMVFRACTELALGDNGERGITLTPAQCSDDRLALIRGLGFTAVKLFVTGDKGLRRALEPLADQRGLAITVEIHTPVTPDRVDLTALLGDLTALPASELWLMSPSPQAAALLMDYGYKRLGGYCFRHPDRPAPPQLQYSPWGFHSTAVSEWLGIGAAAPGIQRGFLHRNADDISRYRNLVLSDRLPVVSWHPTVLGELPGYHRIQQLYCRHRIDEGTTPAEVWEHFLKQDWIACDGRLAAQGFDHFPELESVLLAIDPR